MQRYQNNLNNIIIFQINMTFGLKNTLFALIMQILGPCYLR